MKIETIFKLPVFTVAFVLIVLYYAISGRAKRIWKECGGETDVFRVVMAIEIAPVISMVSIATPYLYGAALLLYFTSLIY